MVTEITFDLSISPRITERLNLIKPRYCTYVTEYNTAFDGVIIGAYENGPHHQFQYNHYHIVNQFGKKMTLHAAKVTTGELIDWGAIDHWFIEEQPDTTPKKLAYTDGPIIKEQTAAVPRIKSTPVTKNNLEHDILKLLATHDIQVSTLIKKLEELR
jgi:hypothetical protein